MQQNACLGFRSIYVHVIACGIQSDTTQSDTKFIHREGLYRGGHSAADRLVFTFYGARDAQKIYLIINNIHTHLKKQLLTFD